MRRTSFQPWRLITLLTIVITPLLVVACGGGGSTQTLPTQPAVGTKSTAAAPGTAGTTATQPAAATKPAGATQAAAPAKVAGDPAAGQQAIAKYGCGGCHTIPGIQGAAGTVGPSLAGIASRGVIAGTSTQNTPDNLAKWIMNPPSIKPETKMPVLGVSQPDAQNIVAFLETLK